jgi:hypothetical protein
MNTFENKPLLFTTTNKQAYQLNRSISELVADDSKTLGKTRERIQKANQLNSGLQNSKLQTLNSSWSPLVDKTANKDV